MSSTPTAAHLPRYSVMVFILGLLACIGPMSIDVYLPAFADIGRSFGEPAERVQLTLGLYMMAYSIMTLLHGTLSDCFGRRPVVLATLAVYALGSLACAAAPSFEWLLAGRILQGISAGAGTVIGQAVVTDCYKGPTAQKTLSYIVMVFGASPALAPILGGYIAVDIGWRGVFVLLAAIALLAIVLCARFLPETLAPAHRQHFSLMSLLRSYAVVGKDARFIAMSVALGFLFGGYAFLIGGAPDFIAQVLKLPETAFGYLFIPLVAGTLAGSYVSARLAGRWQPAAIIAFAYLVMGVGCAITIVYHAQPGLPRVPWAVAPFALFTFGLSIASPCMTLRILERVPELSGTAASVLGFIRLIFYSIISGWVVPLIYGSGLHMALGLTAGVLASGLGWLALESLKSRTA